MAEVQDEQQVMDTKEDHEEEEEGAEEEAAAGEDEDAGLPGAAQKELPHAVKLGHKTFKTAGAARDFFKSLLATWPVKVDMNEYEHLVVLDLLKQHPDYQRKLGLGAKAFQVRTWVPPNSKEAPEQDSKTKAFYVVRKDGTAEDFSYIKCLAALFPGHITAGGGGERDSKRPRRDGGGGGRGNQQGGGGRGHGRGGRRGRGRGGRGRH